MAEDFEASGLPGATGAAGNGPLGACGALLSGRRGGSHGRTTGENRLHTMRMHIREERDRQARMESRRKAYERDLADKWETHLGEKKILQAQEAEERLSRLRARGVCAVAGRGSRRKDQANDVAAGPDSQGVHGHARQRGASGFTPHRSGEADSGEVAEQDDEGAVGDASGPDHGDEAESAEAQHGRSADDEVKPAESNGQLRIRSGAESAAEFTPENLAASSKRLGRKGMRSRKKAADESDVPKEPFREKSIMEEVHERCQGLCRSSDGKEILESGTKHQKLHREALVRGDHAEVEALEMDIADAAEAGSGDGSADGPDAAEGAAGAGTEQPALPQRHLARRHRLRKQQQIAGQLLQCHRQMVEPFFQKTEARHQETGFHCQPLPSLVKPAPPGLPKLSKATWVVNYCSTSL